MVDPDSFPVISHQKSRDEGNAGKKLKKRESQPFFFVPVFPRAPILQASLVETRKQVREAWRTAGPSLQRRENPGNEVEGENP